MSVNLRRVRLGARWSDGMKWTLLCFHIWIMLDHGHKCEKLRDTMNLLHFCAFQCEKCKCWHCTVLCNAQTTKVPITIPFLVCFSTRQSHTFIRIHCAWKMRFFSHISFSWMNFALIFRYYMTQSRQSLLSLFRFPQSPYIMHTKFECM